MPIVSVEHESGVGELAARLLLIGQCDDLDAQELPVIEELLVGARKSYGVATSVAPDANRPDATQPDERDGSDPTGR